MKETVIKVEHLSKAYQLGQIGTGTISRDIERFVRTRVLGKEDTFYKIGETNDRSSKGSSDIVWSLRDINFEIQQGDAVGIIGKNGAGKSTLLKVLSRVTGPTEGQIKVRGRISSLLEVGTGFHPELTGRENIFLNGAILGMRKREISRKLEEIIAFSGVERYIDTPVKRYSSGMYVRLAFAVAAHLESEILIVDEVLAVGDAEFQKKCLGKMGDISKGQGRTVLFVSHNMAAVKSLCTTGILLENGQLTFSGSQTAVVDRYLASSFSAGKQSLTDRTDRSGSGKLRVAEISFMDAGKNLVSQVISGEGIVIAIKVEKKAPVNYSKLFLAVNFQDDNDNFILSFVSDEMGYDFSGLEHSDCIYLKIPNLYLRSASYGIRILLSETDTKAENFLDLIERAATLEVLPGDVWSSGKTNRPGISAIIPGKFDV